MKNYVNLEIINYKPDELKNKVCPYFSKIKTINKLMHSYKFRKKLDLFTSIIIASIGITGLLFTIIGTNTNLFIATIGLAFIILSGVFMTLYHVTNPLSLKYYLFVSNKKLISITGKIENEGVKRFNLRKESRYGASVIIKTSDEKGSIYSTEFIIPCVFNNTVSTPTFDVASGIVLFPTKYYSEEFL